MTSVMERSITPPHITAEAGDIEEGMLYEYDRTFDWPTLVHTIGGTALLCEDGEPMATAGWLTYRKSTEDGATIIVTNGGPSTPTIAHNGQLWGSPVYMPHTTNGHLEQGTLPQIKTSNWIHGADVVYFDPVSTGVSELFTKDKYWHYGVTKDVAIFTNFTKWYMKNIAPEGSPLTLAGSSYGAFRIIGSANELSKEGFRVAGLALMSPAFDLNAIRYDTSDPRNYISVLPSIIMTNHYHTDKKGSQTEVNIQSERFQEAYAFSKGPYADLVSGNVRRGRPREQIIDTLVRLTGLKHQVLRDQDFLLSPQFYADNRLPGYRLSTLDGRLVYPKEGEPRIDPKLDTIEPDFIKGITNDSSRRGIPSIFQTENYQGINPMGADEHWTYDGIFSGRSVIPALNEFLQNNPEIHIIVELGYYDLNTSVVSQMEACESIDADVTIRKHLAGINSARLAIGLTMGSSIDFLIGPHGHQFAHDKQSRQMFNKALRTLGGYARIEHFLHPDIYKNARSWSDQS